MPMADHSYSKQLSECGVVNNLLSSAPIIQVTPDQLQVPGTLLSSGSTSEKEKEMEKVSS